MKKYTIMASLWLTVAFCMAGEILTKTNMPGLGMLTIEKKEVTAVDTRELLDGTLSETVVKRTSQVDRIVFYVEDNVGRKTIGSFTSPRGAAPKYGLVEPTKEINSSFNIVHYQYHADKGTLSLAWNVYNVLYATVIKTPPFPGEAQIEEQHAYLPVLFMNVKEFRFKYAENVPVVELNMKDGTRMIFRCKDKQWRLEK